MLTISKTQKSQREFCYDMAHHEEPLKFQLSDSDSSNSPRSELNPFFANIAQAHSITISQPTKPFVTTANLIITPQNCKKFHQKPEPIGMPLACSTTRKNFVRKSVDEHEITRCSTITISDSDESELGGLNSLSDESFPSQLHSDSDCVQDPYVSINNHSRRHTAKGPVNVVKPRFYSEPLSMAAAVDRFRPSSVDGHRPAKLKNSELLFMAAPVDQFRPSSADEHRPAKLKRKPIVKKSTVAMTPHCARPTRAWLARVEHTLGEVPLQTTKPSRITMTGAERKAVWERLWAQRTATGHHDNDK